MTFKRPVSYVGTTVIDADRDIVCYTHQEYIAARIADALNHAPASETETSKHALRVKANKIAGTLLGPCYSYKQVDTIIAILEGDHADER